MDENNTPANYVQRRKILKILILPMPWNGMVTRTWWNILITCKAGDTWLSKITSIWRIIHQRLKRMISRPAFILSQQIMLHWFMAGWSGLWWRNSHSTFLKVNTLERALNMQGRGYQTDSDEISLLSPQQHLGMLIPIDSVWYLMVTSLFLSAFIWDCWRVDL
jgi:hypothetical protein